MGSGRINNDAASSTSCQIALMVFVGVRILQNI